MGDVTPLARSAEIAYEKIAKGPIEASATLGMPKDEALATLDSDGKVEFPCEVELTDADGNQVATATVALARPAQQAGQPPSYPGEPLESPRRAARPQSSRQ